MAAVTESPHRFPMGISEGHEDHSSRVVPIPTPTIKMSAPSPGDPMDITTSPSRKAPRNGSLVPIPKIDAPSHEGAANENSAPAHNGTNSSNSAPSNSSNSNMPAPPNASAAAHQPKIVQTAFIHKLYNMLEDSSIQHLISWSSSADSFVMSPSADFSKVLSQYFKHTNISSFVRQLNMYGFHKVSDVFHTSNPESALWEFKHGGGNFKRGDLVGLREIKRRASRHSLVHRELGGAQKPPLPPPPGVPSGAMPMAPEMTDPRMIEHFLYDMSMRLQRSEEMTHYMHSRQQALTDSMLRIMHFSQELTRSVSAMVPPENPVHRDVVGLQGEISRQIEIMRANEEQAHHHAPPPPPPSHDPYGRPQYYDGQISPNHAPPEDPRRTNLAVPQGPGPRSGQYYRPAVPSNLSINSSRRPFGSIGVSPTQTSPSTRQPPPPATPHPLSIVENATFNTGRRHTTADIRAHGWQQPPNSHGPPPPANGHLPPFASNGAAPPPQAQPPHSHQQHAPPTSQWPTSPNRPHEEKHIRDSFSSYSMQGASNGPPRSRPNTPPPSASFPASNGTGNGAGQNGVTFNDFSWGGRENKNLNVRDSSVPPTRRGSMAHILNPANDAGERDEDDPRGDDDRKRKRIQ
ncbi:hypothetical protein TD95_001638 [Thielaviopsis punctulata]|uniref:HSF-type DNA-binding domain-containing protein n=1 Tax=Thielaviopsis punctulata TaxID=72032 RepID=A0A0F4Z817_9PEZI|nr:hypothetical protein TD95_001638 [Thielaviopsis punctulata]